MNSPPLVSVIMPAFNAGRFVDAAMASILGQSFGDFEVVVFDDASTDDTLTRLQAWRARDHRVIVRSGQHRGLCAWLNEGVHCARGRWLARMDADDIARPDRFARQVEWLGSHPDVVALGGGFEVIDEEGLPVYRHIPTTDHVDIVRGLYGGYGSQLCHPAVFLDREAVRRVGGYNPNCEGAEDVDLFIRLADVGKLAALPVVLLQYRWHLRSVSHERRESQQTVLNQLLLAAWARRGIPIPAHVTRRLAELTLRARGSSSARDLQERIIWLASTNGHPRTARKHATRLLRHAWRERRAWRIWLETWQRRPAPSERPAI